MRSRHEQVAQIAHRVGLDVVHVPEASQRRLVQGMRSKVVEVDVVHLEATCAPLERRKVERAPFELHIGSRAHTGTSAPSPEPDDKYGQRDGPSGCH